MTSNNAEMSTEVPKTGSSDTEESSHKDSTVNVNMETDPEVNRYVNMLIFYIPCFALHAK